MDCGNPYPVIRASHQLEQRCRRVENSLTGLPNQVSRPFLGLSDKDILLAGTVFSSQEAAVFTRQDRFLMRSEQV